MLNSSCWNSCGFFLAFFMGLVLMTVFPSVSQGKEKGICAELKGHGYGLCLAYCVALDCDNREDSLGAGGMACESLRENWERAQGQVKNKNRGGDNPLFPCEEEVPDLCPCWGDLTVGQVFSDLGDKVSCKLEPNFMAAGDGKDLSINKVDGPPITYNCSGSSIPALDSLSEEEGIACVNDISALCNTKVSMP